MEEDTLQPYTEKVKRNVDWLKPWQYKAGNNANPYGRKVKGESLKEYGKRKLAGMTPKEKEKFLEGLDKSDVWRMSEGNPSNETDITTKGEKINVIDPKSLELAKEYEEKLKKKL